MYAAVFLPLENFDYHSIYIWLPLGPLGVFWAFYD